MVIKMNEKRISYVVISIGLCLIITSVIMLMLDNNSHSNNSNKENNEIIEIPENTEKITIDDLEEDILLKIPSYNSSELSSSFFVFQDKKITTESIDKDLFVIIAFTNLNEDDYIGCTEEENINRKCTFRILKETIKKTAQKYYGNVSLDLDKTIEIKNRFLCNSNNKYYECLNKSIINEDVNNYTDYFLQNEYYLNIHKVIDVEKSNKDKVYIYEKFINVRIEDYKSFNYEILDTYKFGLYKDTKSNNKITNDVVFGKDYYDESNNTLFSEKILQKYEEKAPVYKHTFAKGADNLYYWVSTEEYINK